MTNEELTAIKARAAEVGPGPFTVNVWDIYGADGKAIADDVDDFASALNDRAALIAEVERLRAEIAAMSIDPNELPLPHTNDTTRGDA